MPTCKPFVSPEGLAAAAAAAAADNELKRKSGFVGSPAANLNIPQPVRLSSDSIRQSTEWGPVLMPNASSQSLSDLESPQETTTSAGGDVHARTSEGHQQQQTPLKNVNASFPTPAFNPHEQQIIEAVTNMLAQDKLTAPQAANILQQMLPATSLALLQNSLGLSGLDVMSSSSPLNRVPSGGEGHPLSSPRTSMESARSSFDTARFSMEGRRSLDATSSVSPRQSLELPAHPNYAPPAPAYPQVS